LECQVAVSKTLEIILLMVMLIVVAFFISDQLLKYFLGT
jgi:hypothetical protein